MKPYVVIASLVGLLVCAVGVQYTVTLSGDRAFLADAKPVLAQLQALKTGLDVGYTIVEYRAAVRSAHQSVQAFSDKYESRMTKVPRSANELARSLFYIEVSSADSSYMGAEMWWTLKLASEDGGDMYEARLQRNWAEARESTDSAAEQLKKLD